MSNKRICILLSSLSLLLVFFIIISLNDKILFYQSRIFFIFNYNNNVTNVAGSIYNNNFTNATASNKTLHQDAFHFVSFHDSIKDGRRLGNQIFSLAAVIFVAQLIKGTPAIANNTHILLEEVFQMNLQRVDNLCPCVTIGEQRHLSYDGNAEQLHQNDPKLGNYTILVHGFRQSWKYTLAVERRLRRHLVFRDEIRNFAENYLLENIPRGWKRVGFARVGIHIRRADILKPHFVNYGYTVPNETYFFKAMKHFTDKYSRVQFIVASDDSNWTREHIISNSSSPNTINITYSFNHTAGQDLAILSMCDHVIMSTGTYGWWAAWLAKGTTIYYSDWPRKGSGLAGHFSEKDFFPPFWIPMTS